MLLVACVRALIQTHFRDFLLNFLLKVLEFYILIVEIYDLNIRSNLCFDLFLLKTLSPLLELYLHQIRTFLSEPYISIFFVSVFSTFCFRLAFHSKCFYQVVWPFWKHFSIWLISDHLFLSKFYLSYMLYLQYLNNLWSIFLFFLLVFSVIFPDMLEKLYWMVGNEYKNLEGLQKTVVPSRENYFSSGFQIALKQILLIQSKNEVLEV